MTDEPVTKGPGGTPTVRKQYRLTPGRVKLVQDAAAKAGVAESEIIRRLIDDVLGDQE